MRIGYLFIVSSLSFCILFTACKPTKKQISPEQELAQEIKAHTYEAWQAYKKYAWGSDVLLPISKGARNWYSEPLYISPIDAYSTLHLMEFNEETALIESYVIDSLDFNKDIYVKVFEVNIRVLGGLLSMYQSSGNYAILEKAIDFADRLMPAFDSETGIPHYWVNLSTGEVRGDTVNVAEAGTYTFEMGILSYWSGNPVYYQTAKNASRAVFKRRSAIDLVGEQIDIETGEWVNTNSHICAGIDSYYEYMYKTWYLFGDPEMKMMWDTSILAINTYLPELKDSLLWYGRVDMYSGEKTSSVITLYDAFFPAILALSGDIEKGAKLQHTWDWLWNKNGLEPMVYDYSTHTSNYPVYDLNPEIIESAYYLFSFTENELFRDMVKQYYADLLKYCKTDLTFTAVENVETKEKRDYMATYFLAETLKYLYLTFLEDGSFSFNDHVFSTEAHTFRKDEYKEDLIIKNLGLTPNK